MQEYVSTMNHSQEMKLKVATKTVLKSYTCKTWLIVGHCLLQEICCFKGCTSRDSWHSVERGALVMSFRPAHNPSWHTSTGPLPIPIAFLSIGSKGCHGSSDRNRANGYLSKCLEQEEWSIVDLSLRVFPTCWGHSLISLMVLQITVYILLHICMHAWVYI